METLISGAWILRYKGDGRSIAVWIVEDSPLGYTTSKGRWYIKADWEAVCPCDASLIL